MAIEQSDLVRILEIRSIFPGITGRQSKKRKNVRKNTENYGNKRFKALTEKEMNDKITML